MLARDATRTKVADAITKPLHLRNPTYLPGPAKHVLANPPKVQTHKMNAPYGQTSIWPHLSSKINTFNGRCGSFVSYKNALLVFLLEGKASQIESPARSPKNALTPYCNIVLDQRPQPTAEAKQSGALCLPL